MNECWQTISDYAFRSLGYGERQLPKSDFTLCEHFTLIGSGAIWNLYYGILALAAGFFLATALALAKRAKAPLLRKPAEYFIFVFRGSPLFIQFFLAYEALVLIPRPEMTLWGFTLPTAWVTQAWAGALFVLFLNTAAYTAEIFYGALQALPKGDLEAAEAYGLSGWKKFRRIEWPAMLRLAWPAYTNEAIFLFQATSLVYFSGFPAIQQKGDMLYYANYLADKTFNPFLAYPIVAFYFILLTLLLILAFGRINLYLNRHLPQAQRGKIRLRLSPLR